MWLSLVPFGLGAFFSYTGYSLYKLKKLVSETKTSEIRMVKEGLSEIKGHAQKKESIINSPFSGKECFYCKYYVEEPKKDNKGHTHWRTVAAETQFVPFLMKDETGEIEIDPSGAEIESLHTESFSIGPGKEPGVNIKKFLDEKKISYKGFFGIKSMRFKEV